MKRPPSAAIAAIAARTRILILDRSAFESPPNIAIIKSWASDSGSTRPPTSGTHSSDPKWQSRGNVSENWFA